MKIFRSRFMLLVLAILALRFILMIALPLADSTEGRYAMIGARMLTESDWVTPRVWFKGEDLPFLGKPPLHFWGEAVAMQLIGLNELAARLPAFVAGAVLLGLMFTVLKRYRDRRLAQQAVLMTATTVMFFILSGAVAVDLTLATFSTGGILAYMGFLAAEEPRVRRRFSLLVFACLGLGFMTKGPILLLMFGLPVFAWTLINRQWQTLRGHAWGVGDHALSTDYRSLVCGL